MIVYLNVTVALHDAWEELRTEKEIRIQTEHADDSQLPWEQICAGLVQGAIKERLDKEKAEEAQWQ